MARARDVVLVRHGQTTWSATGRHTGRTDIPLTDEGRSQSVAAGALLAPWSFSTVLTSPLGRALETCRAAGFEGEVDPTISVLSTERETPAIRLWNGVPPPGAGP